MTTNSIVAGEKNEVKYTIRNMTKTDVPEVLNVWKAIGLYEGMYTIYSFMEIDADGLFVAVSDDDGKILGCCAGIFVDKNTAFIGLYAVLPEFQRMGIGIKIWAEMIKHIGDKNAGLYAVPGKLSIYRDRANFRFEDKTRVIVYDSDVIDIGTLKKEDTNISIMKINDDLIDGIIEYDADIVGHNRGKLLRLSLNENDSIALVAIDNKAKKIIGYGCLRKNNDNKAMAGPIYVDNQTVAEILVHNLVENFPLAKEKGVYFMAPDTCPAGKVIAKKLGLQEHEDLPRFFNKFVPNADFERILCIHSPNFSPF